LVNTNKVLNDDKSFATAKCWLVTAFRQGLWRCSGLRRNENREKPKA
jgi:hypothetical protein